MYVTKLTLCPLRLSVGVAALLHVRQMGLWPAVPPQCTAAPAAPVAPTGHLQLQHPVAGQLGAGLAGARDPFPLPVLSVLHWEGFGGSRRGRR